MAGQIIVLALAISLMPFAHPQADDFCRSGSVMQQGLIESLRSEYMGWSGRWSGTGMSYVVPLFADVTHTYGLILLAAMGVLGSGVYSLVSALVAGDTPRSVRLFATATILAIHWSGNHATGDNYYWLPGAFEYHLGVALGFLLLAAMLKNPPRGGVGAGGGWRIALSSVGALFIAGMHELYAAMLCGVLAVGTVVALKERDPRRFLWASVLGAGLTGFLVVFFAPGNQVRSPSWVAIDYALAVAARQAWGVVKGWLIDTKLLSATALLAAAVHLDYIRPRWGWCDAENWKRLVPGIWLLFLWAGFFVPAWVTGVTAPPRTLSALFLVFLTGWFLIVLLYAPGPVAKRVPFGRAGHRLVVPVGSLVLAGSLLFTGNTPVAMRDLMLEVGRYDSGLRERYASIRLAIARGERDLRVFPLLARPRSFLFRPDIRDDPNHWSNRCVALFFGAGSIALSGR